MIRIRIHNTASNCWFLAQFFYLAEKVDQLCNCVYGGVKLVPLRVLFSLKYLSLQKPAVPSVLRIHDILVWDPDQDPRIHASG
jgi:hypothetical protein